MPIPITIAALLLLTAAIVLLRLRWPMLSSHARRRFLLLALLLFTPTALSFLTHWETTSIRLNDLLGWFRVLAYMLVVVFFTLLRPRWLTSLIATVLLLPLLSASFIAPLADLFTLRPFTMRPIGGGFFLETAPWTSGEHANSGVDFTLFRRPPGSSLFRRGIRSGRLYNSQCDTANVFGTFDPAHLALDLRCPPLPGITPSGTELHVTLHEPPLH